MAGYYPEGGLHIESPKSKTPIFQRVSTFALWAFVIIEGVALLFTHVDVSALRSTVAEMVADGTGNSRHTQPVSIGLHKCIVQM